MLFYTVLFCKNKSRWYRFQHVGTRHVHNVRRHAWLFARAHTHTRFNLAHLLAFCWPTNEVQTACLIPFVCVHPVCDTLIRNHKSVKNSLTLVTYTFTMISLYAFIGHFSGPARVIGPACLCVCVRISWNYLGQVWSSTSWVKINGHKRKIFLKWSVRPRVKAF